MEHDPATAAVLLERDVLLELLDAVRLEHPLCSAYVHEHLYAAAVRRYLDTPEALA